MSTTSSTSDDNLSIADSESSSAAVAEASCSTLSTRRSTNFHSPYLCPGYSKVVDGIAKQMSCPDKNSIGPKSENCRPCKHRARVALRNNSLISDLLVYDGDMEQSVNLIRKSSSLVALEIKRKLMRHVDASTTEDNHFDIHSVGGLMKDNGVWYLLVKWEDFNGKRYPIEWNPVSPANSEVCAGLLLEMLEKATDNPTIIFSKMFSEAGLVEKLIDNGKKDFANERLKIARPKAFPIKSLKSRSNFDVDQGPSSSKKSMILPSHEEPERPNQEVVNRRYPPRKSCPARQ